MEKIPAAAEKTRILPVSTSRLWSASARPVLSTLPNVELLETARGSLTAAQVVRESQPHIIIIDDSLPIEESLLIITGIKQEGIRVYCILMVSTTQMKENGYLAGADAVIFRTGSAHQLEQAVITAQKRISANQ
jgi:DNA-binding NarL/FixJ family response regulator